MSVRDGYDPFWDDPLHDERQEARAAAEQDPLPVRAYEEPVIRAFRRELALARPCTSCGAAVGELCIETNWRARMERVGVSSRWEEVRDYWTETVDDPHVTRYPPETAELLAELRRGALA